MSRGRILIVDDEPSIGVLFEKKLSPMGWSTHAVDNPAEALAHLQESHWHVLITDIVMPEMDGFTLIREANALRVRVPAIAMTAHEGPDTITKLLKSDCFGYLTKPIDFDYLGKLLDKAASHSRRLQARPGKAT
ncbi:MAG: response regulator [Planctomycetota bacterium]